MECCITACHLFPRLAGDVCHSPLAHLRLHPVHPFRCPFTPGPYPWLPAPRNYPAAHRDMRDRLRSYAAALPPATAATHGSVGALALSCGGLPFAEAPDVQRCLPCAAVSTEGLRVRLEAGKEPLRSCVACVRSRCALGPGCGDVGLGGSTVRGVPCTAILGACCRR